MLRVCSSLGRMLVSNLVLADSASESLLVCLIFNLVPAQELGRSSHALHWPDVTSSMTLRYDRLAHASILSPGQQ